MSELKSLVVVYQFGKVASTALVDALNRLPEIESHQCHFLGDDALRKSITNAADGKLAPYFRKHLVGQLFTNLDLTYRVNRIRGGLEAHDLKVISMAREPVDWLRSCIQQDIEGYREAILQLSAENCRPDETPSIEHGLTFILECLVSFIEAKGGIEKTISAFRLPNRQAFFADSGLAYGDIVRRTLMLAFRPLLWFEDHFQTCFDVGLHDFERHKQYWRLEQTTTAFLIFKYEDIEKCLPQALGSIGLNVQDGLTRANVSENKPFSSEIYSAFASGAAQKLRTHVLSSDYARFFGYNPENNIAAA